MIRYPTRHLHVTESDASAVTSLSDCIVRTDMERGDGTIIRKATVLLQ